MLMVADLSRDILNMSEIAMSFVVRLNPALARDLNRVRRTAALSQAALAATTKKVSQGTVSNFLRGQTNRGDPPQLIYRAIATGVEQAQPNRQVGEADLVFARATLAKVQLIVEGKTHHREPLTAGFQPSALAAMAASHLTEIVMALTDSPGLVVCKAFDFASPKHFRAHARCVDNGIKY